MPSRRAPGSAKSEPAQPAPHRAAKPAPIPMTPIAAKKRGLPIALPAQLGRPLLLVGAVVGALVVIIAAGIFAMSLFGGKTRAIEKAVLAPHREQSKTAKGQTAAPTKVQAQETPRPDPAQLAAGVPRTLPEARRLATEGKLEAARVVLADMVRAAPDNIAAIDALKGIQARIDERDKVAESMEQIRRAYKQERFEDALRMLYRLPPEIQRGEVEQYKANAWYSNGINYLRGGNTTEAVHCFEEALNLDSHDQQAQKLKAYARTYQDREKDSAFLSFVDQLEKRPIDTK
jgi:tetratricopeptide (TPR) repeat protein